DSLELENVTMLTSVPKDDIQNYIGIIDVALVNLKKSKTFENVTPSKIFENTAMGKPVLLGVEGESKELIETYNAGVCFEPENENSFIDKLYFLKLNSSQKIYLEGCKKLSNEFSREKLAAKMLRIIEET